MSTKYCKHCGELINKDAVICVKCGCQVEELKTSGRQQVYVNNRYGGNPKNKWVALCLCLFLGILGAHKFYEDNPGAGILYIFTGALCGVGMLVDLFIILFKPTTYYV